MPVKFLIDMPALFIEDKKALLVADLHLGIENELYKSGIVIIPQAEKFAKMINRLIDITRAKKLVILGDVKHEVPGISFREIRQIPKFFDLLSEECKVLVVKGNHDTNLEDIIMKKVKVYSSRGFKLGKYGFFHGHAWPSKALMRCDYLFMGHVHPAVEFRDDLGYRNVEQVWVKGELEKQLVKERYKIKKCGKLETVILPAFNRMLGGVVLNATVEKELIGPLLVNRFLELDKSKVYMLDGTYLGSMSMLKRKK
jgi:putative SbcD/Mre11-related phosphoesterase